MPDILSILSVALSAIGAVTLLWGVYFLVRGCWYKIRLKLDKLRMQRDQLTYAKAQFAKNAYEQTIVERDATIIAYQDVVARQKAKIEDLTDEVYRLNKRNILFANEMRSDHKAPTEFLPPPSGRFARGL